MSFGWPAAGPAFGQAAPPAAAGSLHPAYDVVSIKPLKPDDTQGGGWRSSDDGFIATTSARTLIISAYGVFMENQISGLPGWAHTEEYVVNARMDPDRAAELSRLPREERGKMQSLMIQSLLAERFHLKARREVKELPVYELVVARSGTRLKETPPGTGTNYSVGPSRMNGRGIQIAGLVFALSGVAGRLIVDKTGLKGKYDIDLTWSREEIPGSADNAPSIFAALEEQLGLKLEPARAPVDTIVVEHIERPSEN